AYRPTGSRQSHRSRKHVLPDDSSGPAAYFPGLRGDSIALLSPPSTKVCPVGKAILETLPGQARRVEKQTTIRTFLLRFYIRYHSQKSGTGHWTRPSYPYKKDRP